MADEIAPRASTGEAVPHGESRASHQDRDRVVELLRVAAGDGRLTAEELDERVEAALTARTYNELAALVADLPDAVASTPAARPRDLVRIDCQLANADRRGRWTVPQRIEVRITHGHVTLDFTDADIALPTLQIDAQITHGHLTLVTKPGIEVNTDDLAIHGGHLRVGRAPGAGPGAGVPVMLRVDVSGRLLYSNLRVRSPGRPRRTFWQWLTRQPRPAALPPGLSGF
jgi:hypothetical protein